jgi:hypothetical protein
MRETIAWDSLSLNYKNRRGFQPGCEMKPVNGLALFYTLSTSRFGEPSPIMCFFYNVKSCNLVEWQYRWKWLNPPGLRNSRYALTPEFQSEIYSRSTNMEPPTKPGTKLPPLQCHLIHFEDRLISLFPANNEQLASANALAADVLAFNWKPYCQSGETPDQARSNHFQKLRSENDSGWAMTRRQAGSGKATKCQSVEQVFTQEFWQDAKNVYSIPVSYRPTVLLPAKRKKQKASPCKESNANGAVCSS